MDYPSLRKQVIKKYFGNMNDRQFEAVTTVNGPLLVLAGAGSGKTATLTDRIVNRICQGHDISRMLVVTFTNDAANELKTRIAKKLSDTENPQGIFCICKTKEKTEKLNYSGKYLALENLQDPSNLGAVCRTVEALGLDELNDEDEAPYDAIRDDVIYEIVDMLMYGITPNGF